MADLIEIDAASNRGIDDIRSLREKIRLAPVSAARKVYIIDEVHMLTTEAFNALLKTLEEPPAHALFVLATTEAHRVPETIKSRCMQLIFAKATPVEVVRSLKKVVKGEKLAVEKGGLEMIAEEVDGSFREGMKIMEQLSLSRGKITLKRIAAELGKTKGLGAGAFLQKLAARDLPGAVKELDRLNAMGVDWKVFLVGALEILRVQVLRQLGVETESDLADGELGQLTKEELLELIDLFQKAGRELRLSVIEQLPFEIVAIEWCSLDAGKSVSSQQPAVSGQIKAGDDRGGKIDETKVARRKQRKTNRGEGKGVVTLKEIGQRWDEVLKAVRPDNHSVEGLLRSTKPTAVKGDRVKVEVFYQFHLDQLKQERFLQIVEAAIERLFATGLRVEYYLGKRPEPRPGPKATEIENIRAVGPPDEDVVKVAEEIFGGE